MSAVIEPVLEFLMHRRPLLAAGGTGASAGAVN